MYSIEFRSPPFWKQNKTKIILGIITLFIVTPLLMYTNCGTVDDEVHQKIFIDPAGEKLNPPLQPRMQSSPMQRRAAIN